MLLNEITYEQKKKQLYRVHSSFNDAFKFICKRNKQKYQIVDDVHAC